MCLPVSFEFLVMYSPIGISLTAATGGFLQMQLPVLRNEDLEQEGFPSQMTRSG